MPPIFGRDPFFMKSFFLLLALVVMGLQPVRAGEFSSAILTHTAGGWAYEKVVTVAGVSKKDLYERAKVWVLGNVKSVDVNTAYDDKNQELIVTTPTLALPNLKWRQITDQAINFKLQIAFKDGKAKVSASGLNYFGISSTGTIYHTPMKSLELKGYSPDPYKQIGQGFDDAFLAFITALQGALNAPAKSDW